MSKFILLFLLVLLISIAYKLHEIHLRVDFKSFFNKGFRKNNDDFGVYVFTGKQGTGKTFTCVNFLQKYIHGKDIIIITNLKSLNIKNKKIIYIKKMTEIIQLINNSYDSNYKYIIFYDEIFSFLNKNYKLSSHDLKLLYDFISQLRKREIILLTTAQVWADIPLSFRRQTRFQIGCKMFRLPIFNRAFLHYTFNDADNMKWDEDAQDFVAPTISTYFGKAKKSVTELYDTFEVIHPEF